MDISKDLMRIHQVSGVFQLADEHAAADGRGYRVQRHECQCVGIEVRDTWTLSGRWIGGGLCVWSIGRSQLRRTFLGEKRQHTFQQWRTWIFDDISWLEAVKPRYLLQILLPFLFRLWHSFESVEVVNNGDGGNLTDNEQRQISKSIVWSGSLRPNITFSSLPLSRSRPFAPSRPTSLGSKIDRCHQCLSAYPVCHSLLCTDPRIYILQRPH